MSDPTDEAPAADPLPPDPPEAADEGLITKGESERFLGSRQPDPNRSTFDAPRDRD